jgi:hypothetical protein
MTLTSQASGSHSHPAGEVAADNALIPVSGRPRDPYVRQVGSHKQCAKAGCPSRSSWRVILGHHVVQAYVCQAHLAWGVQLDMITESTAKALGWETGGHPTGTPNYRIVRQTMVTPEMPAIRRVNFAREVNISASFPQYEMRTVPADGDMPAFAFEMSVWE